MDEAARARLVANIAGSLSQVSKDEIVERSVATSAPPTLTTAAGWPTPWRTCAERRQQRQPGPPRISQPQGNGDATGCLLECEPVKYAQDNVLLERDRC